MKNLEPFLRFPFDENGSRVSSVNSKWKTLEQDGVSTVGRVVSGSMELICHVAHLSFWPTTMGVCRG